MATTAVAFVDLGAVQRGGGAGHRGVQDAAGGAVLHARAPQHEAHKLVVVGGLLWLGILIFLTLADFATRGDVGSQDGNVRSRRLPFRLIPHCHRSRAELQPAQKPQVDILR